MSITLLGDIAFTGLLSHEPEKNSKRFNELLPILNSNELVFANLEVPIKTSNEQNQHKAYLHYSLPKPTKELLKLLNISCVSLANNHIYDYNMGGLKATINMLNDLGIYHTGAGWKEKHIEPVIIDKKGTKIGFLAYVDKSTNPKTEYFPELFINYLEPVKIIQELGKLKGKVDKIILSLHWGTDYSYYPLPQQREMAKSFVDAGADIIMGHHPHTLQPFEEYKKSFIFYSLGTSAFGDIYRNTGFSSLPLKTKKSVIIKFNLFENKFKAQGIKIKKYGFVKKTSFNFNKWSKRKMEIHSLMNKYSMLNNINNFKESFLDRVYEHFFGYYKTPFKEALSLKFLKKLSNSYKEFNRLKNIK